MTPEQPFQLTREEKAQKIVHTKGAVSRIDEHTYSVKSQSGNGAYVIVATESGWKCACRDHYYRGAKCKHIWAVEYSIELRKEVQASVKVIAPISSLNCRFCNSQNIVRDGVRHNKYGDIQKYNCKDCKRYFTINVGFEGMRAPPQVITGAMQLYFSGESLRNVQRFIKLQGYKASHMAIYRWIKKYVGLMEKYLEKITPNVSDTWRTDELYLKIKGNTKYLYALMDDETRFWIAQQVADTKYTQDVRPLFNEGREIAGKKPMTLISDGAPNFHNAYMREYFTHAVPRTKHIQHIHLKGDKNNNKMERMNGEIRDREKVMRGLKKMDTPVLAGYQIYHNYFREHESLGNHTPAEIAGIKVEGENKWITMIQNAAKQADN
ncbi:DDE-type integrase/transposase/recombinase [Nitrososphaera viennensis]|uniref:DDE-type integrase/transposase/recombinase n=2 Tax=Nitrososphaera viennensis TaxID=1034015 RepID=A0A977IFN9_9ARCH|nr:DDE-type integrase/transposase/recombinase [Nitrososphaera viennensis]AIC15250.1 putative integrase family protein [Nitrososphaera viennensis EN76]UVS70164.1 DDE-type integrase/transposase/recombinase [Nitrososphaera viennensis]